MGTVAIFFVVLFLGYALGVVSGAEREREKRRSAENKKEK